MGHKAFVVMSGWKAADLPVKAVKRESTALLQDAVTVIQGTGDTMLMVAGDAM
jgi:hypothetical protein